MSSRRIEEERAQETLNEFWRNRFKLVNQGASFGAELQMWPSVQNAFVEFSSPLEGVLDFMYLDNASAPGPYVTTGMGNLIDPIGAALALLWRHNSDNSLASQAEVETEWNTVKARKDLAPKGGGAFKGITSLHIDAATINEIVASRLAQNEKILMARFANYTSLPADAQLGLHSMAWNMGAAFGFPKFSEAILNSDFTTAANECKISNGSEARNTADKQLFENAALVEQYGLDPSVLWYPDKPEEGSTRRGEKRGLSTAGRIGVAGGAALLVAGGYTYRDTLARLWNRHMPFSISGKPRRKARSHG